MNVHDIEKLINELILPPESATEPTKLRVLIWMLAKVVEKKIPGDVVELGCFNGASSIFIQSLLLRLKSEKQFHVYDVWTGLPKPGSKDDFPEYPLTAGDLSFSANSFINVFFQRGIPIPIMNSGLFSQIPDCQYPETISFAYFDSLLYQSILDSWFVVYDKLSPGAIVLIDDYGSLRSPGVKVACDEFLEGRSETVMDCPVPYQGYCKDGYTGGGYIVKR
jgi:O-methyltransferase